MRRLCLALLPLYLACLGFDSPQPLTTIEDGGSELTGTWDLVDLELPGGIKIPPNQFKNFKMQMTFHRDGKLVIRVGEKDQQATYLVRLFVKPRFLDIVDKGHVSRGIFEIKGNKLKICVSERGSRPTAFTSNVNNDSSVFFLERKR